MIETKGVDGACKVARSGRSNPASELTVGTETSSHIMAYSFNCMNISHRTGADGLSSFRIMPCGVERFGNHGPYSTMRPCGSTKGMIMPEYTTNIGIHPEPLPHIFHCHNIVNWMIIF